MIERRVFLAGLAALPIGCATGGGRGGDQIDLAAIQGVLGADARLGVAALDSGSGRTLLHDADSRFAMCSTIKLPLAAAVLTKVDRGEIALDEALPLTQADILSHSPVSETRVAAGAISVEDACAAVIEISDNAAANLLLRRIGGPQRLTAFTQVLGDYTTRFDRYEPELNIFVPGDPRDTTTPLAMLGLLRAFLLGDTLSAGARRRLIGWMESSTTGRERLRAGLPAGWRVGDKTGTAGSANNDVAIAWPPQRAPILIASYIDAPSASGATRNGAHAAVAQVIATAFA